LDKTDFTMLFSVNGIIGAGGAGKAELTTIKQCQAKLSAAVAGSREAGNV
jgi:hypothetical protein